jgi:hypothetical protein
MKEAFDLSYSDPPPAPAASSAASSMVERERYYATKLSESAPLSASIPDPDPSSPSRMRDDMVSAAAAGETETKLDEVQREMFNTVQALSSEKEETKRLRDELIGAKVAEGEQRDKAAALQVELNK